MMVYVLLYYPYGGAQPAGVYGVYDELDKAQADAEHEWEKHFLTGDVTVHHQWKQRKDCAILTTTREWTHEGQPHALDHVGYWRVEAWVVE